MGAFIRTPRSCYRHPRIAVVRADLCVWVAEARKTWSEGVSVGMWWWDFSLESLLEDIRRSYGSVQKNNLILPISFLVSFNLLSF